MACRHLVLVLLALLNLQVQAQTVTGVVRERTSNTKLTDVTVLNKMSDLQTSTDSAGTFKINGKPNQVLIFYKAGYRPDTLLLIDERPVFRYLVPDKNMLATVEIKADNFDPEVQYADVYRKAEFLTAGQNIPLTFYTSKFFSKEGRFARRFKKCLELEKTERKIDQRFNNTVVRAITPLEGRELDCFMVLYRPAFKLLNKLDKDDLLLYIMNSYKAFKLLPAEKRVLPTLQGSQPLPHSEITPF